MTVSDKIYIKTIYKEAHIIMGFFSLLCSCSSPDTYININGQTMGTTYSIKINVEDKILNSDEIKSNVDSVLNRFNTVFSTWDYDSEISLFNRVLDTNGILISDDLKNVINKSLLISDKTNGYFDVTVFDLMSFWGFGPEPYKEPINLDRVDSILNFTGYKFLKLDKNILAKKHPLLKIDLNSIAKGYGVDKLFNYLVVQNFKDIFVEIGGEVRARGKNSKRSFWKIGIEHPNKDANTKTPFAGIIELNNKSMATSGNYRNFIKYDKEVLGHTINPRTGYPVNSNISSVTVISNSCIVSDAWATALMAMEYQSAIELLDNSNDLDVIWILNLNGENYIKIYGDVILSNAGYKILK